MVRKLMFPKWTLGESVVTELVVTLFDASNPTNGPGLGKLPTNKVRFNNSQFVFHNSS